MPRFERDDVSTADAVKAAALEYALAAYRRDFVTVSRRMSRPAQGICLATALAEGHVSVNCADALTYVMARRERPDGVVEPSASRIHVISVSDERATVSIGAHPDRQEPFTFVLEDGEWKLAPRGLND